MPLQKSNIQAKRSTNILGLNSRDMTFLRYLAEILRTFFITSIHWQKHLKNAMHRRHWYSVDMMRGMEGETARETKCREQKGDGKRGMDNGDV